MSKLRITAKFLLGLLLPLLFVTTASGQTTSTRPVTTVTTIVNTPHNAEGDLQQPLGDPFGLAGIVQGQDSLIEQTTGGTDHTLTNNWEGFQFTVPPDLTRLGAVTVRFKITGGITPTSFITAFLYTDVGGKPGENISPQGSGLPSLQYAGILNSSTPGEVSFNLAADVTPGEKYWVLFTQTSVVGGSFVLDTAATGTAVYATNNTDATNVPPSGGTNWTTVNNISPYFRWAGDTFIGVFGYSDNYGGVQGRSKTAWGGRFDSEYGPGSYSKSRYNFGVGGASVFSFGGRFSSLYGVAFDAVSAGSYGGVVQGTTGGLQAVNTDPGGATLQLVPLAASSSIQVVDGANGYTNSFQMTNTGKVQIYNSTTTAGQGLSYIVGTTGHLTAQSADVAANTLVASVAEGMYEVCAHVAVTRAATSSSTLPSVVVGYDNGVGQAVTLSATAAGNTTTTVGRGCSTIVTAQGTAITYATTGYASSGATSMQFDFWLTARAIF